MNILALVDEGTLALSKKIEVLPRDIYSGVSEIEKRWPAQTRFPLNEMIHLMLVERDNTGVETLFRVGGGKLAIANRLRKWKITGVRVDRSERQCSLDRNGVVNAPPPSEWTDKLLSKLTIDIPESAR